MDKNISIKNLILSFLLSGTILTLILASCTNKETLAPDKASYVVTDYDAFTNFANFKTYYLSDTVFKVQRDINDRVTETLNRSIIDAIETNMESFGYTRIFNPDSDTLPDIRISTSIFNKEGIPTDVWYPYFSGWGSGSKWEKWISPALIGTDSVTVKLTIPGNKYLIVYDSVFSETDTVITPVNIDPINFTAESIGMNDTWTYEFFVDGISQISSSSPTFQLESVAFPALDKETKVSVKLFENDTLKATDELSIFGILKGSESITAFLTNSTQAVASDANGNVDSFENAGGEFRVFIGENQVKKGYTFSSIASYVDVKIDSSGVYRVMGLTSDIGAATFKVALAATSLNGIVIKDTIEANYIIYKSKKSKNGVPGYYQPRFGNSRYEETYPSNTLIIELANPKNKIIVDGNYVTPILWTAKIYEAPSDINILTQRIDTAFIQSPYLNIK